MKNFYLIGLTGNLASGKSTVRRMLEQLGAFGIDADLVAHAAMQRGAPAWDAIVDRFGSQVLQFNGKIDRQKLGSRVFGNAEALAELEAILHPAVGEIIRASLREMDASVAVVEAVKLVEAGMHLWCDALWIVTSANDAAVQRVVRDRQMPAEDARARLAAQGSLGAKLPLANVIIDNSHDLNSTRLQVQNAWKNTIHSERAKDKTEWLYGVSAPPTPPSGLKPPPAEPITTRRAEPIETETLAPPAAVEPPAEPQAPAPEAAPPPRPPEPAPSRRDETSAQAQPDLTIAVPPAATKAAEQREETAATSALPEARPREVVPGTGLAQPETRPQPAKATTVEPVPSATDQVSRRETIAAPEAPTLPALTPVGESSVISVRRARRGDTEILGAALARREKRSTPLARDEVLRRFGKRGYRIAVAEERVIALAAWEAENLVAMTRDIWAESELVAGRALPRLFELVEKDAGALQCEVSLILVEDQSPAFIIDQVRASGYEPRDFRNLHRLWHEVVEERMQPGDVIWAKRLREDMVTKPI